MMNQNKKLFLIGIVMLFFVGTLSAQIENWVYMYDGPDSSSDEAYSIVYGLDGNIYAAGYSTGDGTGKDFTVISLTTAGDTNWVYRYNLSNDDDEANSIVYGGDGNIYAAGYSKGSGTDRDFTVISLRSDNGSVRWIYRYNGAGNGMDEAYSIVYGDDGNIYAAGYSEIIQWYSDFTVISFTTEGDTNWVYQYDGPINEYDEAHSIVYGADGNLYAAGYSSGSSTGYDFMVIGLKTTGDTNWVYRYDGPDNSNDKAHSIVYGVDNNIYVAGYSRGNGTNNDFTVISLSTAGDTNWVYRYDGPGSSGDEAYSIIYGADGNIYAAGLSRGVGTGDDFTVISLTNVGDTNWVYRYNGPSSSNDAARSIVYGANNNLYIAGKSHGVGTSKDLMVINLTPTGIENWVYRYNGTGNLSDAACSIVYGADGNIYAAGYSNTASWDFAIVCLGVVGVNEHPRVYESTFDLLQNIPNPFRRLTTINYHIAHSVYASIKIYNSAGQLVQTLVGGIHSPGDYTVQWDGTSEGGDKVSSGVYFYEMRTSSGIEESRRMLILR